MKGKKRKKEGRKLNQAIAMVRKKRQVIVIARIYRKEATKVRRILEKPDPIEEKKIAVTMH